MSHDEFLKELYELKSEAESAKEDYLSCLENQKKAKIHWAILKRRIKELRENYHNKEIERE